MKIIFLTVLTMFGFIVGYNISKAVDKMVSWKQSQNNRIYTVHRIEYDWDNLINAILVSVGFLVAFYYLELYESIFTSIMCVIAVFGARLDERIRIIPNELVLLILTLGLVNQLVTNGLKGLGSGFLALIITAGIFFISAFITKLISSSIGVGAGDIKLAMALSLMMGIENVFTFLIGIVLFLLFYIMVGFLTKRISVGSSFPMCTQIMGGCMITLYQSVIIKTIKIFTYM